MIISEYIHTDGYSTETHAVRCDDCGAEAPVSVWHGSEPIQYVKPLAWGIRFESALLRDVCPGCLQQESPHADQ